MKKKRIINNALSMLVAVAMTVQAVPAAVLAQEAGKDAFATGAVGEDGFAAEAVQEDVVAADQQTELTADDFVAAEFDSFAGDENETVTEILDEALTDIAETGEAADEELVTDSVPADDAALYDDPYWDMYSSYFFYNQLTDAEKTFYDGLNRVCMNALAGNADIPDGRLPAVKYTGITYDRAQFLVIIFLKENPQYYFISTDADINYDSTVVLKCYDLFRSGDVRSRATAQIRSRLDNWREEVNAQPTTLAKEKKAHDLVAQNATFDYNEYDQSAYSALILGKTVCTGYSKAFEMLLNASGIDADMINSAGHAWNIVRIDGNWYYVDLLFDDNNDKVNYKQFNRSAAKLNDFRHEVVDGYLNMLPPFTRDSGGKAKAVNPKGTAAAPRIQQTASGANYTISLDVNDGSTIWYTVDGQIPGSAFSKSNKYTGPFEVKKGSVVRAKSEKFEYLDSEVVTLEAGGEETYTAIPATGVSLDSSNLTVEVGRECFLTAVISPFNATDRAVTWTSSNPAVATVSPIGVVKGKSAGDTVITATTHDGEFTASCTVHVTPYEIIGASSVTLDKTSATLEAGKMVTLTATIEPSYAEDKNYKWSSSDTKVATVYPSGKVLTHFAGEAVITATATNGRSASCKVTVTDPGEGAIPDDTKTRTVTENVTAGALEMKLTYTGAVEYDGRAHVVKEVGGKTNKETASVNPDIEIKSFEITLNGEPLPGVTLGSVSYKNNKLPSYDGVTNTAMTMSLGLKFDTKNVELSSLLKKYPEIKKTLTSMAKPSYNKKTGWNYQPVEVNIKRVELCADTPVFTLAELKDNPELKATDGILVWGGNPLKDVKYEFWLWSAYVLSCNVKGMYYQKVFTLPGGNTVVKKITLKSGKWKMLTHKENGFIFPDGTELKTKAFDYIANYNYDDMGEGSLVLAINGDDADWGQKTSIKKGNFTGVMPKIVDLP